MGDAKKVCDRVWEMLESGKLEGLAEIISADCEFRMPGMAFKGIEAFRQMFSGYITAFPDLRHHVRRAVESNDFVALELEVTGTHTGPMQTPQGAVPATGKKVTWDSCDVVQVREGQITSWHAYYDTFPVLTALGVLSAPG